jgi:hypothetical protein
MKLQKFLAWQLWFHYFLLMLIMTPIALYFIPSLIGGFNVCYLNPPYPITFLIEYFLLFGISLAIVDLLVHASLQHFTGWDD